MPLGRDQGEIAAHVERVGAGIKVGKNSSPRTIARAVERVLAEPHFRDAARRMAEATAAETAEDHAVTELEALAGKSTRIRQNSR
jgi:UDP:flavonoid glycosyltransferase YjiC (YdhE family)